MLAKSLGTTNPINMARATVNGLQRLRRPEDVARSRGKSIKDVLPFRPAEAQAPTAAATPEPAPSAVAVDPEPVEEAAETT